MYHEAMKRLGSTAELAPTPPQKPPAESPASPNQPLTQRPAAQRSVTGDPLAQHPPQQPLPQQQPQRPPPDVPACPSCGATEQWRPPGSTAPWKCTGCQPPQSINFGERRPYGGERPIVVTASTAIEGQATGHQSHSLHQAPLLPRHVQQARQDSEPLVEPFKTSDGKLITFIQSFGTWCKACGSSVASQTYSGVIRCYTCRRPLDLAERVEVNAPINPDRPRVRSGFGQRKSRADRIQSQLPRFKKPPWPPPVDPRIIADKVKKGIIK